MTSWRRFKRSMPPLSLLLLFGGCLLLLATLSYRIYGKSRCSIIRASDWKPPRDLLFENKCLRRKDRKYSIFNSTFLEQPESKASALPNEALLNVESDICGERNVPCVYPESVDIRIIVLTFSRPESLSKCLQALQLAELNGAKAAIEIWIDRHRYSTYNDQVYAVARQFRWKHGPVRVHVWKERVGLYGQWMDTWRPRRGSSELGIILEDDTDLSPFSFVWLRQMHKVFGSRPDISGYSLHDDKITDSTGCPLTRPETDPIFMFPLHGNWGFAPHPLQWRRFQDWYHTTRSLNPKFEPTVPAAATHTRWYEKFVETGKVWTFWEIWYFYFCYQECLWSVHSNIRSMYKQSQGLANNRREVGLHHKDVKLSTDRLITEWKDSYAQVPQELKFLIHDGSQVSDPLEGRNWKTFVKKGQQQLQ